MLIKFCLSEPGRARRWRRENGRSNGGRLLHDIPRILFQSLPRLVRPKPSTLSSSSFLFAAQRIPSLALPLSLRIILPAAVFSRMSIENALQSRQASKKAIREQFYISFRQFYMHINLYFLYISLKQTSLWAVFFYLVCAFNIFILKYQIIN